MEMAALAKPTRLSARRSLRTGTMRKAWRSRPHLRDKPRHFGAAVQEVQCQDAAGDRDIAQKPAHTQSLVAGTIRGRLAAVQPAGVGHRGRQHPLLVQRRHNAMERGYRQRPKPATTRSVVVYQEAPRASSGSRMNG